MHLLSKPVGCAPGFPVSAHPSSASPDTTQRGGARAAEGGATASASPLGCGKALRVTRFSHRSETREVGRHTEPSGPNRRAVRRGGMRATQIGPSEPRLQGGPGVTNPSGEEGAAGLRRQQRYPWRARDAAAAEGPR